MRRRVADLAPAWTLEALRSESEPVCRIDEADAVEFVSEIPRGVVDTFLTDPAYASLEKHRAKGTTTRLAQSKASSNPWFPIFPDERTLDLFEAMALALVPHGHMYVMCDPETEHMYRSVARATGLAWNNTLIWDKGRMGMGWSYRRTYECIVFLSKGKRRKLRNNSTQDVLRVPGLRGNDKYPTEKPVELFRPIVEASTDPGGLVVDPFLGSGSVAEAALSMGRRFAGCDIESRAVERARARVAQWTGDAAS